MTSARVTVSAVQTVASGAVVTQVAARLHVTLIAKATFALRAEADMELVDPEPLVAQEQLVGGAVLMGSPRATSELAPFMPAADVLFTGHACVPGGSTATTLDVRLAVAGQRPLVDKTLRVSAPQPFRTMPIVYERAYGGLGFSENPLGTGYAPSTPAPNVIDPHAPKTPAGFGPISAHWPPRRRLLKPGHAAALGSAVPKIPDDIDWTYFLASPPDQRTPYLQGNEWILLENLLPDAPRLRSRLPDVRALTSIRWTRGGDPGAPTLLPADTLRIDGDTGRCVVVFRGVFPVPEGASLDEVRAAVGLSLAGGQVPWALATRSDQADDLAASLAQGATGNATTAVPLGATLTIAPRSSDGGSWQPGPITLPFAQPSATPEAPTARRPTALPGTPWSGGVLRPVRPPSHPLAGTIPLDDPGESRAAAPDPVSAALMVPSEPTPTPIANPVVPAPNNPEGPWASPPAPAPPPPPRRPPPPQTPAAVITSARRSGYDRFKR